MPPAVALIGIITTSAAIIKTGLTIMLALQLIGSVISFAMSIVSMFGSKPKKPSSDPFSRQAQSRTQLVRSAIEPHRWVYGTVKVSGPMIYASSTGADNQYIHLIVPLAGHESAGIDDIFVNEYTATNADLDVDGNCTNGDLKDLLRVKKYLGSPGQTADPTLIAEAKNSEWTTSHVGKGITYIYVRLLWSNDKFGQSGLQNISAIVRGKLVYDPRNGTTVFSNNGILCMLDYLRARDGFGLQADEWDPDHYSAQANICDENVTITSTGTTQKRYVCNGTLTLDQTPPNIVQDLLSCFAGVLTEREGKYWAYAAKYRVPTESLGPDDLSGPLDVKWRAERSELFNIVRGTYVDPNKDWQPGDFPINKVPAYIAEDNGVELYRDIELPFTTDPIQAQRLARLSLEIHRRPITVRWTGNFSSIRFAVMDTLFVTYPPRGWVDKVFRVVDVTINEDMTVEFVLREEDPNSYEISFSDLTAGRTVPTSSLRLPNVVDAPVSLSITEELYITRDGAGVKSRAILSWVKPADPYIREYQIQYRPTGSPDWISVGNSVTLEFWIDDLAPGSYDFKVRSINIRDRASEFTEATFVLDGLLAPPADVAGLRLQAISSLAVLGWTAITDLDVVIGGSIEVRHSPLTSGATWENSTSIADRLSGRETMALVPLKTGTYLVKAVDSSGTLSAAAAAVSTDAATVITYTDATTPIQEDPTFPGTKTNCGVNGSVLELTGSTLWDDIAVNIDSVTDLLDGLGGQATAGTYVFNTTVDLTTVKRVQLRSHVKITLVTAGDLIDTRTQSIDDWLDVDGSTGARGDVIVYARTTPDNPGGAPVWSAWFRCDVAEVSARGIQFKAEMSVEDKSFNIQINELRATVKEVL